MATVTATVQQPTESEAAGSHGDQASERHAAFATHVLPEADVLLRVALSLTHQLADAEDLVQDTMIRASARATVSTEGTHVRGC